MKSRSMTMFVASLLSLGVIVSVAQATPEADDNFHFPGDVAKVKAIDPITDDPHPHLHVFFCNKSVNADSTIKSLESHRDTTCPKWAISSYWKPAEWEGGDPVNEKKAQFYYVGWGDRGKLKPFPKRAKIIATRESYRCGDRPERQKPPYGCTKDEWRTLVEFQQCWTGKGREPDDFAYRIDYRHGCPSKFPVHIPALRIAFKHENDGRLDRPLKVAAGNGERRSYTYMHADVMSAQTDRFRELIRDCVLNPPGQECNAGGPG